MLLLQGVNLGRTLVIGSSFGVICFFCKPVFWAIAQEISISNHRSIQMHDLIAILGFLMWNTHAVLPVAADNNVLVRSGVA